ncbi:hypothetical protein [Leifsonia sp. LS-T14]|uniref:hypothetical protein n=1 Tax=unclassified Leifsonia TaxID=2663824 RepID=UPI0035A6BF33
MKRALALALAAVLGVGVVSASAGPAAAGARDCEAPSVGVETYAETELEAEYNDMLTLCDLGQPQRLGDYQYSFTNDSPVVWAFYDAIYTGNVPRTSAIKHATNSATSLFSKFTTWAGFSHTEWVVAPGETVWLSSLTNVKFGVATALITSSWLFYNQQAKKLADLGKGYAANIATNKFRSKTRTFLWQCSWAAVNTANALKSSEKIEPLSFASAWASSAVNDYNCGASFKDLFPKKKPGILP